MRETVIEIRHTEHGVNINIDSGMPPGQHDQVVLLGMLEWAKQSVLRKLVNPLQGRLEDHIGQGD